MKLFLSKNNPWGVVATGFALMTMRANAVHHHHHHHGSHLRKADGGTTSVEGERNSVIGGNYTNGQEFPFYVQAQDLACGGSLVAPDVVLTAAHCAPYWKGSVLVGSYRLNSTTAGPAQWREILGKVVVHPQFSYVKRSHDLSAFRIEPVTLPNLQPVRLNDQANHPVARQWVTLAGYGVTETPDIQTQRLRKAQLKIVDNDSCQARYQKLLPQVDMDMTAMLCTSGASSTKRGPSNGDSGGPLVDSNMTLIGVVSWGPSGADAPDPDVYARVSGHLDWIKATICQLSSFHANLSFPCTPLVCPPNATLKARHRTVALPSALNKTQIPPGFVPVNVTQIPPAGTLLNAGTKTVVTVLAQSASSSPSVPAVVATCQYTVTVPPPKSFKQFKLQLPKGATPTPKRITMERQIFSMFKLSAVAAKLSTRNLGPSAIVRVTVFKGSVAVVKFVMRSGEETFGRRTMYLPASIASGTSNVRWTVEVSSSGLSNAVSLTVDLLGRDAW